MPPLRFHFFFDTPYADTYYCRYATHTRYYAAERQERAIISATHILRCLAIDTGYPRRDAVIRC